MSYYIIRYKNTRLYVDKIDSEKYSLTYNIDEAKQYSEQEKEISYLQKDLCFVDYNKEKYRCKEEDYIIFANYIALTKKEIKYSDLILLIKNKNNEIKKDMIFVDLQEKYPDNKLLDEMCRVICNIEKVEKKTTAFDFDYSRQKEILEDEFNRKYLSDELIEEGEIL